MNFGNFSSLPYVDALKPRQVRVYLREKELQMLQDLVEITGMKDTAVLSILCSAALKAAKEVEYHLPLALKFTVTEDFRVPTRKGLKNHR